MATAPKPTVPTAPAWLDSRDAERYNKYVALGLKIEKGDYTNTSGRFQGRLSEKLLEKGLKDFKANPPTPAPVPITTPAKPIEDFQSAVNNYQNVFQKLSNIGIDKLDNNQQQELKNAASIVREQSYNLDKKTGNIEDFLKGVNDASGWIDNINSKKSRIDLLQKRYDAIPGKDGKPSSPKGIAKQKLQEAEEELASAYSDASTKAQYFPDLWKKLKPIDFGVGASATKGGTTTTGGVTATTGGLTTTGGTPSAITTAAGLGTAVANLSSGAIFDNKNDIISKTNNEVSDADILSNINTGVKEKYLDLYNIGNSVATGLQSQITTAEKYATNLPANDPKKITADKEITALKSELTKVQEDTLKAKNLYDNYKPLEGGTATKAVANVRQTLLLPEERTLKQIDQIDPTVGATVRGLAKQYQAMAETKLAPTTSPETEAFRRDVEQRIAGQVALGSQLGAEEQRQYQQAARAAQTARGNIFGVAPAVEEAVTTGLAGEQRLQARLGAAQGFLASGQTMSDAMARDVGLRNALDQSRLGAAQGFIASGPTLYNLASQRLGTQQAMLNNYLAASQPQATGGFQATPSAANPYAYVNPNAGFIGAQNAAGIYNTLADYQAKTYGANVGALASQPSGAQQFAQIAGGISSLLSPLKFG